MGSDDKSDWAANSIKSRRGPGRPAATHSTAPHSNVNNLIPGRAEGGRRRSKLRSRPRPFRPIFISESTTTKLITTTTTTTKTSTTTRSTTIFTTAEPPTSTKRTTAATTITTKTSIVPSDNFDLATERFVNPFRSRGGRPIEKTSTAQTIGTQHTIGSSPVVLTPFFDLQRALEHAEKTWAQDPFRKIKGLPGKPVFDIDYTKNPATSYNELDTTLYDLGRKRQKSENLVRTSIKRNDPQIRQRSRENHRSASNTEFLDISNPLETFLWTPALLREPAQ